MYSIVNPRTISLITYGFLYLAISVGYFNGLDFNRAKKSFTDGFLMGFIGTIVIVSGICIGLIILLVVVGGV